MTFSYESVTDLQRRGIPAVIVTVVEKKGEGPVDVGKKMVVGENGEAFGTVGGGALEFFAREKCKDIIRERTNILEKYTLSEGKIVPDTKTLPMICGGFVTLFYEYVGAKEYVYIFGAGHVGQALANILKTMNFHISVIDDREPVLSAFQNANVKFGKSFVNFIEEDGIRPESFIIVCTPSHLYDYHVMNKIIERKIDVKYVGMLCSAEKISNYLDKTYEQFGHDVDLSRFYSPVGLDLGGNTPEEIAISISSEMLAVSHSKIGHAHMRETRCPLAYWKH
ncbi:MAG: XdhC/CoxI family protein [Candidatus Izemoplasmatales bacterium]|jgi:xanthine dehydrogenase accessory factor